MTDDDFDADQGRLEHDPYSGGTGYRLGHEPIRGEAYFEHWRQLMRESIAAGGRSSIAKGIATHLEIIDWLLRATGGTRAEAEALLAKETT